MANEQQHMALGILKRAGLLRPNWFPTFAEFTERQEMAPAKAMLRAAGTSPAATVAFFELLYALLITSNSGGARFRLTQDLVILLRDTDLPNDASGTWLRLPFEGVTIEVPPGTFTGPARDVTELYLVRIENDGRFRCIFASDAGQNTNYISIPLSEEKSIGQLVEETRARAFDGIPAEDIEDIKNNWAYEDYFASDVFTLAVNAALYITSAGADVQLDDHRLKIASERLADARKRGITSKKRLGSLEQNVKEAKEHKIYICGGHLHLDELDRARA